MIDQGFLIGYAFGCLCTAAAFWLMTRSRPRRLFQPPWKRPPLMILGAVAHSEVADLAVSAGQFISSVRSMRRQIDSAHDTLTRGFR